MFDYLSPEDSKAAQELARRIADGHWCLFTGAGTSQPSGLPSAFQLTETFARELLLGPGDFPKGLDEACTRYENTSGKTRGGLIELLTKELSTDGKDPSWLHDRLIDLLQISPAEIFTTNAEDMWEKAFLRRGIDCVAIIVGLDLSRADRQQMVIKLHGDLKNPDSLVFSKKDYRHYPKDQLLSQHLRDSLVRNSFLFIGYSAGDANLAAELDRVFDLLDGKTHEHFLVTDTIPDWRRNELFRDHNMRVIELKNYDRLPLFLAELAESAKTQLPVPRQPTSSVAGLGLTIEPLKDDLLIKLFTDKYEPIHTAINNWRLDDAEKPLSELIQEVGRLDVKANAHFRDFYQRLLLAAATIAFWQGKSDQARGRVDDTFALGPLSLERAIQAGPVVANIGDLKLLAQLTLAFPNPKLQALLSFLEKSSDALRVLDSAPDDADVRLLRVQFLLDRLGESNALRIATELKNCVDLANGIPPALLQIATLSDVLLRRIVDDGLVGEGLDRNQFLKFVRIRYEEAIAAYDGLGGSFTAGLTTALSGAMLFFRFIDDDERFILYRDRLARIPNSARGKAFAEYLLGDTAASLEIIDDFYRQSAITVEERALLISKHYLNLGMPEPAEQVLREVLASNSASRERDLLVEALLRLLIDSRKFDAAEAFLQTEVSSVRGDFTAILRGLLLLRNTGRLAAIDHLRSALQEYPRSRLILDNLLSLLFEEARIRRNEHDNRKSTSD